ncbi:MAG: 2-oxo acid dehydrogenase subunit E2 [Rhodanobacteraceae bacterium]
MSAHKLSDAVIPLRAMRKMIADKMRQSLATTAQLTHHAECDASALARRRAVVRAAGGRVSVYDLLIHYIVATLREYPVLNATLEDGEIHLHAAVNVSIAVSLDDGLLVAPAIFDAQEMTLAELSAARRELTVRARAGKLSVREMTGGTITVSNLGLTRVKYFTPILNVPQVAVIGIGGSEQRLVPTQDGSVESRAFMGLSLTFDHQAVNGAPAAAFLDALCRRIEKAPAAA